MQVAISYISLILTQKSHVPSQVTKIGDDVDTCI